LLEIESDKRNSKVKPDSLSSTERYSMVGYDCPKRVDNNKEIVIIPF
jgi:hypothetical protein